MDWDPLNCLSSRINNMPSTVTAAMDRRLVEGMTYIYQEMQTRIPQAIVILATRMSVLRESRTRSSQALLSFPWQIMKCLDSASDIKHFSGSFRYNVSLTWWCVSCTVTGKWMMAMMAILCGSIKILSLLFHCLPTPLCQKKTNWLQGWYYGRRTKFIGQYFN